MEFKDRVMLSWKEFKRLLPTMSRSSLIGTVIGIIPAAGTSIAAFLSYDQAKRASKHPEEFGHGSIEGVAAPETANYSRGAYATGDTMGVTRGNFDAKQ